MSSPNVSPFTILGVSRDATDHEIRKAFCNRVVKLYNMNWEKLSDEQLEGIRVDVDRITGSFQVLSHEEMRELFLTGDQLAAWKESERFTGDSSSVFEQVDLNKLDMNDRESLHAVIDSAEKTIDRLWKEKNAMFNEAFLQRVEIKLVENKMTKVLKWINCENLKRPGLAKFVMKKAESMLKECREEVNKIRATYEPFELEWVQRHQSDAELVVQYKKAIDFSFNFLGLSQSETNDRISRINGSVDDLSLIELARFHEVDMSEAVSSTEKKLEELQVRVDSHRQNLSDAGLLKNYDQAADSRVKKRKLSSTGALEEKKQGGSTSGVADETSGETSFYVSNDTLKKNLILERTPQSKAKKNLQLVKIKLKEQNEKLKELTESDSD